MFPSFSNLFRGIKDKNLSSIPNNVQDKIHIFSENINLFKTIDNNLDKKIILKKLINEFDSTFQTITSDQVNIDIVNRNLKEYNKICQNNCDLLFTEIETMHEMFESFIFITKLFNNKVLEPIGFNMMFFQVVKHSKTNVELLPLSYGFLEILFRNNDFFVSFEKSDGFSIVFSSIFTDAKNTNLKDMFLNLLFCVIPRDYFKAKSYYLPIDTCLESLTNDENDDIRKGLFLTNYLTSYSSSDKQLFTKFYNDGGFLRLNKYLNQKKDTKRVVECYSVIFLKCNQIDLIAAKNFYELFVNATIEIRTEILKFLNSLTVYQLDQINKAVSISEWILYPKDMNLDGYEWLLKIIQKYPCDFCINKILKILQELPNINEFGNIFFSMLTTLIKIHPNQIEQVIQMKFLDNFIFSASFSNYLDQYSSFQDILFEVYSALSEDCRYSIFSLVLNSFKPKYCDLLYKLIESSFTMENLTLILNFIENDDINSLIIKVFNINQCAFDMFNQCNGFEIIEQFVSKKPQNVLDILVSLTKFGQKSPIDDWINSLPIESPLFSLDQSVLSKAAVNQKKFLSIPSLLPYLETFDCNSPICLFNAGKYGIKAFEKRNISYDKIPNLHIIANRYASSKIVKFLQNDLKNISLNADLNIPQIPVFEFSSNGRINYIKLRNNDISDLEFKFYIPFTGNDPISILKFFNFQLTYQQKILCLWSSNGSQRIEFNTQTQWVYVHISVMNDKIEINLNGKSSLISIIHEQLNQIIFGDDIVPITQTFLLSKDIFINKEKVTQFEIIGDVYNVGYNGFASYFDDFVKIESLFQKLESCQNIQDFNSLYILLISLQIINNFDKQMFWTRLLVSMKKSSTLIKDNILLFFHQLPSVYYSGLELTDFYVNILKDIEIYFTFPTQQLNSFFNLLENDIYNYSSEEIDYIEKKENLIEFLLSLLRTGIENELQSHVISIISILSSFHLTEEKIKLFFNYAYTSGDWQFHLTYSEFPINSLMNMTILDSQLQIKLLSILYELIVKFQHEVFDFNQLLRYVINFDEERALFFYDIIMFYSFHNPKYVVDSQLSQFAFSMFSTSPNPWIRALSILNGSNEIGVFPSSISIQRPNFVNTILAMVTNLINLEFTNTIREKNNEQFNLLYMVVDILIKSDLCNFINKNNFEQIQTLSNLDILPETIHNEATSEIKPFIFEIQENVSLTKEELNNLSDGTLIYNNNDLISAKISVENIKYTPDIFCEKNISKLPFNKFIEFLSYILFNQSTDSNTLKTIMIGNSLMYDSYYNIFAHELTLNILNKYTENTKITINPLPIALEIAKMSIFDNDYILFLSTVLTLMEKRYDSSVIQEFRSIILLSFIFIDDFEMPKLFELLLSFSSIVFTNELLNDYEFCILMLYNVSIKDDDICMEMLKKFSNQKFLTDFDHNSAEIKWNLYQKKLYSFYHSKNRVESGNLLMSFYKKRFIQENKYNLSSKITRIANLYNNTEIQFSELHKWLRKNEMYSYLFMKNSFTYKYSYVVPNNSYHLSQLALPIYQQRVISPSPFSFYSFSSETRIKIENFRRNNSFSNIVKQVDFMGELHCSPEWCYFPCDNENSPFKYSFLIGKKNLINDFQSIYGSFKQIFSVFLYYYIHPIPCILFYNETKIVLLVLARYENQEIELIDQPAQPITFIPFTESVGLNEWYNSSLFCGHIVLTFEDNRIVLTKPHLYIHQKRALSFFYLFVPNFILIFNSISDFEAVEKLFKNKTYQFRKQLSSCIHLFNIQRIADGFELWINNEISNFDYLLLLNASSGRSFSDAAQYPVFPWIVSPNLECRDLSLPMGQLSPKRAKHYDETFNDTSPPYFYGCHYSLPGVIFWFLMRLPPFNFFLWDLNDGWDNSKRTFVSVSDAYISASSTNQTDLKELLPECYSVPEMFINVSNLSVEQPNVTLPEWSSNSPYLYTSMNRKFLESSNELNKWIDLIFGSKQLGEAAVKAKNVFLPSSYHTYTPESTCMDQTAFEDQVINFGQCPLQLFTHDHSSRSIFVQNNISILIQKMEVKQIPFQNTNFNPFKTIKNGLTIPKISAIIPPKYDYFITVDKDTIKIQNVNNLSINYSKMESKFEFVTDISISNDALFLSLSYKTGIVEIYLLNHQETNQVPMSITLVSTFRNLSKCKKSEILSSDYLCASIYRKSVIVWNIATQIRHRELFYKEKPRFLLYDDFEGILTVALQKTIYQYSINCEELRSYDFLNDITSIGLFPGKCSFDRRILIVGESDGNVSFFIVNDRFGFSKIGEKKLFKSPVTSIFVDSKQSSAWVSSNKTSFMIYIPINSEKNYKIHCKYCCSEKKIFCQRCNSPVCEKCSHGNYCNQCAEVINLHSFGNS